MEGSVAHVVNIIVDSLFLVDMIIIFNSAYVGIDLSFVDDRCLIARNYLQGWFWIDLVSILPFNLFFPSTGENA